jgi:hypothetical protein
MAAGAGGRRSGPIVRLSVFGRFRRCRSRAVFKAAGAPHARQGPDRAHPVGEGRDEPEILLHVLLADPAGRYDAPGRERNGRAEDRLKHENALCMVPERAVPEISGDFFRLVEKMCSGR